MSTMLVCGGRGYTNRFRVFEVLDKLHAVEPVTLVIHGDSRGADRLAGEWAKAREIAVKMYPADWKKHGKSAGPIRNREMLDLKPDRVVGFPGGDGTRDCTREAERRKITTILVEERTRG